jgi:ACR3 family arsenite transporter
MSAPATAPATHHESVAAKLSTLDRWLPAWMILAMAAGLLLGRLVPGLGDALSAVEVDGISLPIALGLLDHDVPGAGQGPLRPPRHRHRATARTADQSSLVFNWVLGPALMFALAWLLLPDLPEYRTGLIIVGLARCIAMVIIWNDLACGDREAAAVLVALNSVFQVLIAFAALGWFYLSVLPGWLGLPQSASIDTSAVADRQDRVLIFLGIPLLAGYLSRRIGEKRWGRASYESSFLRHIGPWALYGLFFTIVILFALQGDQITNRPMGRRPHRAAPAGLLRDHVGRGLFPGKAPHSAWVLRPDDHARVHRRGQQLRAGDRGGDRDLRRHLGPGPRGCGRAR